MADSSAAYVDNVTLTEVATPSTDIESIAVTKQPTKADYQLGESLDTTGLEVTATLSDGTMRVLDASEYTLLGFDSAKAGVVPVTVKLNADGSKVARFRVRVQNVTNLANKFCSSAAASDVQTRWGTSKASYTCDNDLSTNWSNWKDSSEDAPANPSWLNWTFDKKYQLSTLEFYLDQTKAEAAPAQFKVQYLDDDGNWADTDIIGKPNADDKATPTTVNLSSLPATKAISLIITPANYGSDQPYSKVAEVKIFQAADPLPTMDSLKIEANPSQTKYTEGDMFSASGLKVQGVWSDGSAEELLSGEYTLAATNASGEAVDLDQPLPAGDLTITVTSTDNAEAKATFTVSVAQKQPEPEPEVTITSIAVAKNPSKTTYTVGDLFSADGLKVNAALSNGTVRELGSDEYKIFAFDAVDNPIDLTKPFSATGELTVMVRLKSDTTKTATFAITVKAKGGSNSTDQNKTDNQKGDKLTDSGSSVTVIAGVVVVLVIVGGILLLNRKRH